jgi:hypothetical protein
MAEPVLSPVGARLRERTQPLAPDDGSYGWAHAHLCEAIGLMLEQVAEVFDPEGDVPPLAPILDPELCPDWALPWLAQFVGVAIPPGTPPEDALTSETPDPAGVLALLTAQKPGGIVLRYRTVAGWDYQQMTTAGGTYAVLKTTYATYYGLRNHQPGT